MSTRSKVIALVVLGAAAAAVIALGRRHRDTAPPPAPSTSASVAEGPLDAGAPDATAAALASAEPEAEDAGPPEKGACAAFRATNDAITTRIAAAEPKCNLDVTTLRDAFEHCAEADAGAWSLVADNFSVRHEQYDQDLHACGGVTVDVALVHVDKAGAEKKVFPLREPGSTAKRAENWSMLPMGWGSRRIDPPVFFDFDGDGELEVIVTGGASEEGPDPSWHEVWTYKMGRIEPYPPLLRVDFDSVSDVDQDGRPDLLTRGPYEHVMAESGIGGSWPVAPALFVLHSEKDGSFDGNGAVARDTLKKSCPQKPVLADAVDLDHVEDVVSAIVCARAWGVSEHDVRAALAPRCEALCTTFAQDCDVDGGPGRCPGWLAAAARVAPRLRLR